MAHRHSLSLISPALWELYRDLRLSSLRGRPGLKACGVSAWLEQFRACSAIDLAGNICPLALLLQRKLRPDPSATAVGLRQTPFVER